jgi:hypothetical protein
MLHHLAILKGISNKSERMQMVEALSPADKPMGRT